MISLHEAWRILDDAISPREPELCPITQAAGRVLCDDIISPVDIYPFRASTMDGFAVRSEWLQDCSPDHPVTLPIGDTIFAGDTARELKPERRAIRIMTGAALPDFCDAVFPFEHAQHDQGSVTFTSPAHPGMNVRPIAEDVRVGQKLFARGEQLQPYHIGLLAAMGFNQVVVHALPSLLVASIGNELVPPGEPLTHGKIYDTNSAQIGALISRFCRDITTSPIIRDDPSDLRALFEDRTHDITITSGAVSAGDKDHVVEIATACGWQALFHKVSIKPGMPIFAARRQHRVLLGLPGNPLSATVTCALFAIPALKRLLGMRSPFPKLTRCTIAEDHGYRGDRTLVWPAKLQHSGSDLIATLAPLKSSAALSVLISSGGLAIIQPPGHGDAGKTEAHALSWHEIL